MNAVFGRGGLGGRRAGAPHCAIRWWRTASTCALVLTVGVVNSAAASVLYRCTGPQGEVAYVSHTGGYQHCEKIGAWATPKAVPVRATDRGTPDKQPPPVPGTVAGTPPQPVKADPAVLQVTPLGEDASIKVRKLATPQVWQPFAIAILDKLGNEVLPRLLGVEVASAAPAATPPPAPAPVPAGGTSAANPVASAAIPLHLDAAPKPTPPRTGAVYRVVQKDGSVLYTNIASLTRRGDAKMLFTYIVECYACNVHSKVNWDTVPLKLTAYDDDIRAAVRLTGVNAALLRAIIHAESGFNPRALSYKGAQGLMQLMPGTAYELGVGDAFDPAENISGGARYLAMLLRGYHGDVRLAAAAYNAGAGAVAKYGGVPPYAETQVYVKRVALLYQRYRKALAGNDGSLAAAGIN